MKGDHGPSTPDDAPGGPAGLTIGRVRLIDLQPAPADFRSEVLRGLAGELPGPSDDSVEKRMPPKFFYDERGSALFDRITELPEYYPTRTELAITRRHIDEIVSRIGQNALLIEFGSGSSIKTRVLLDHLPSLAAYVPVDISREHLLASAGSLADEYPDLEIIAVCADYTQTVALPDPPAAAERRVVYFPGSTIGNLLPHEAAIFMERIGKIVGPGGGLLIGVDLMKDPATIVPAYDDRAGVTAAFNKNLLVRINRELDGDFDPDSFEHRAVWRSDADDPDRGRVEMHLVSTRAQEVSVAGQSFEFHEGEPIVTEYSYKYGTDGFRRLAERAGFRVERVWTDDADLFSVQFLNRSSESTAKEE